MTGSTEGCTYCGSDAHGTTDCRWRDQLAVSEVIAEDNAREVPPSVAEFAVQSVAELQAAIAQRDARIEELVRESERLSTKLRSALLDSAELAALKSRPAGGVEMPERRALYARYTPHQKGETAGWNACLDEVARLNSSPVSAGGVDERAARVPDAVFQDEFMVWWEGHGQFCRAGGGDYERTFAFQAWRHLYPMLMQARAALAGRAAVPDHSEQLRHMVPPWNLAADVLPACGHPVLAYYINSHGKGRRIRAEHVTAWTVQADELSDPDTECVDYSEQEDAYYIREGWYELIDNWDEYSRVAVHEGVITHWMPLAAAPSAQQQGEGHE